MKKTLTVAMMLSLSACGGGTLGSFMTGSPSGIIGTGVRDQLVEPGIWQINARSAKGFQSVKHAQSLALERAANLVEAAGDEYVHIMNFHGTENGIRGRGTIGADIMILVKGVSDPKMATDCRAASKEVCSVLSIRSVRTKVAMLRPVD